MNDDANSREDKASRKIFPRNLTAKAEAEPRGNPPSTRPEDGVDNCFPGYDFDQRNLEKRFFPGLVFEFHLHEDGAIVTDLEKEGAVAGAGVTKADGDLFLWAIAGQTLPSQTKREDRPRYSLEGLTGLDVWARVRDLMPGDVAIVLGNAPAARAGVNEEVMDALQEAFIDGKVTVKRDGDKKFQWAAVAAKRATYVDADTGVIAPDRYAPGELTRSLCTPWQYDFRDCGCHYWAASKPDVVTSEDGSQPYSFYMRRDRASKDADLPAFRPRIPLQLDYAELIAGDWNAKLEIVIGDQERTKPWTPPRPPGRVDAMGLEEIITELTYLATVEHALTVQYLFAHYSLNAPIGLTPGVPVTGATSSIFAAANEVLQIAIDEMRHMRWVNEALQIFQRKPSLGRAKVIGRSFCEPFKLVPLTPKQLEWFIKVEEPSRSSGQTGPNVDGMYVRVLAGVQLLSEAEMPGPVAERSERKERLIHLLKLIIDEGDDHYHRFLKIKAHLAPLKPEQYLRPLCDHAKRRLNELQQRLVRESDNKYREMLDTLALAFSQNDGSGVFFEQARRAMRSMHENNHLLAAAEIAPPFNMPQGYPETTPPGYAEPDGNGQPIETPPASTTATGDTPSAVQK